MVTGQAAGARPGARFSRAAGATGLPPYGIYDIGTDHDTGVFAVASIRGWWRTEGRAIYARAKWILITADDGGSNGYRLRLLKLELQKFTDQTRLRVSVCHFPPGTSKGNKL